MALNRVDLGIQYFPQFAADRAIANAQIYIGQPNLDPAVLANQIQAYVVQENGTQVAVPQPIRTGAGGVPTYNGSPVEIAVNELQYSLKALTSTGSQIYYKSIVNSSLSPANSTINLENYTALRAYVGVADTVYITGILATAQPQGIAGVFQYDETDVTSADNGGTIIVGSDGRRWKRVFNQADGINVQWFGAIGDATADDTAAIQATIDYCKSKLTGVLNTNNGGQATVFIPQGMYKISSTLSCNGANGLKIYGSGIRTTTLAFVGTSSSLFNYTTYIDCKVSDMTVTTGTITFAGGLPQVIIPATRTNKAFNFNGTNGGTNFEFDNVAFWSFDIVFNTTDNITNVDNHVHRHCRFFNNNYVWNNTNTQAVAWSFLNCKVFSTQIAIFNNPGGDLLVQGGDYINPGTFYRASLANLGLDATFYGVRFENNQNNDPSSAPKFIELIAGGSYSNILFDHCTARGGGILTGKTSGVLAGSFNVTMRDCSGFSGNWEVTASSAVSGFLSGITFQRCVDTLVINQTLSGGVGNQPISIEYLQRRIANTTADRRFYGRVNSLSGTTGIFGGIQSDSFGYAASLNASAFGRDYTIFCPAPYQLAIAGFDIVWTNNTANTVTIDIYTDNTKATKIASVVTASASGQRQVINIPASALLVRHTISSTSLPLFFEATAAANAGTCSANVNVNLLQI